LSCVARQERKITGGYVHIRFWNSTSRILRGVKSVGGFVERAVPAEGDCTGVKKGAFGAGVLLGAIVAIEARRRY
jgi:hypothetical protein